VGRIVYQRKHTLRLYELTSMTGYGAYILMNEFCSLLLLLLLLLLLIMMMMLMTTMIMMMIKFLTQLQ